MRSVRQSLGRVAFFAAAALLAAGCPGGKDTKSTGSAPGAGKHEHPEEGPHGGALAEWGEEEFHIEFKADPGKKQATVYILDGAAKKVVPIEAETVMLVIKNVQPPANITLKADPQKDDPKGKSSRFVGTHDALAKEMEFKGEISGKVGAKAYAGDFEEKAHKDHKHDKK